VKIFASGNLDEFKIRALLERNAPIDNFGVGTNMGTSIDAPCLGAIYKISEVTDEDGKFLPTMKLSKAKVTYPGRKQVFRIRSRKGKFVRDVLGLEKENITGLPLLVKVVDRGRVVYRPPALDKIRLSLKSNLQRLPIALRELHNGYKYPVAISPQLNKLRHKLSRQLSQRQ